MPYNRQKKRARLYRNLLLCSLPALFLAGCLQAPLAGQNGSNEKTTQNDRQNRQNQKNTESQESQSAQSEKDDDLQIDNLQTVTSSAIDLAQAKKTQCINSAGTFTLKGIGSQPVVVDAKDAEVTLQLENVQLNTEGMPAIYVRNASKVTIRLIKENTLTATHPDDGDLSALNAAIYSRSETVLEGDGTLTIESESGHALKSKDDLTIRSGRYVFACAQDGFHASDNLQIAGGTFDLDCGDEGFEINETAVIQQGTFTIRSKGDALRAQGDLTIQNGTWTIDSQNEGLESKAALLIENGTFTIRTKDDCINAASALTIRGGTLELAGGTINAAALRAPEGAFDTDRTDFTISGGTIVGLSAMATRPTITSQNTIMLAVSPFTKLELKQNGKTLIEYASKNQAASPNSITLTLSCRDLQAGMEAELLLDGKSVQTFTIEEGLTVVGSIATMDQGGQKGGGRQPQNGQPPQNGEFENGMPPARPDGQDGEPPMPPFGEMPEDGRPKGEHPQRKDDRLPANEGEDAQSGATGQNQSEKGQTDTSSLV